MAFVDTGIYHYQTHTRAHSINTSLFRASHLATTAEKNGGDLSETCLQFGDENRKGIYGVQVLTER